MARCNILISLTLILLVLVSYAPTFEARIKLLKNMEEKNIDPSQDASVLLSSLPKGHAVPPSSPSDKGHVELDRNMELVPSPGIGN
ncbi:precursor of CEP13-like [Lycium barbarum]|uniref:precursor of CEP13-like n=1 Tax=Lycium barbarum TaxID=112863 RepID=UPI00293EE264|nr:precursor of CEP13-like [Lycium barbarum]